MRKVTLGAACATAAMAAGILAGNALGAPNPDSAAGRCGPPGQTVREVAQEPGSAPAAFGVAPGLAVKYVCAPGQG